MGKKLKTSSIVVFIVALIVSYELYLNYIQKQYINPQSILIHNVEFVNADWVINGEITNGKEGFAGIKIGFSGVDYRRENDEFYLRLQYGIVRKEPAKYFTVYLGNELNEVNKVYLQGNQPDDVKLIWEK